MVGGVRGESKADDEEGRARRSLLWGVGGLGKKVGLLKEADFQFVSESCFKAAEGEGVDR